jgi:hypothetical protein
MRIDHVKIYDLEECVVVSGLPMLSTYNENNFVETVAQFKGNLASNSTHLFRICKLASNPSASRHCDCLKGILVALAITGTQAQSIQAERYGHFIIDSKRSKMHCLTLLVLKMCCHRTTHEISRQDVRKQAAYDDLESLVYGCPMGVELTARVNTNYMPLCITYHQRKAHR